MIGGRMARDAPFIGWHVFLYGGWHDLTASAGVASRATRRDVCFDDVFAWGAGGVKLRGVRRRPGPA
jgi:hypothetical protein